MQPEGQPADGRGGGAALAAQIDAALDAAFDTVVAALAQAGSLNDCVSAASTGAVAELLVRGLSSPDASVARGAAIAIPRFVRGGAATAAARAVAEASGGAAVPALARLAASGGDATADAAWEAMVSLWIRLGDEARSVLTQRYAAADGAVEGLINAVMRRATPFAALQLSCYLIDGGGPEVSAQFAAADGFCARLVSLAAAVGDSPSQPSDACCKSRFAALGCMDCLLLSQPTSAAPAWMAAEGLWPALEGVVVRAGRSTDDMEVRLVTGAIRVVHTLSEQSAAGARHAAGLDGLLAGLAAALTQPRHRQWADMALQAIATHGGGDGEAAVAVAVAGALACAADDATRQELRDWLVEDPMIGAGAIGALERMAVQAAALRARVAEFEAIPVNTRAAVVELAHAVRGKRRREEDEGATAALGKEQRR